MPYDRIDWHGIQQSGWRGTERGGLTHFGIGSNLYFTGNESGKPPFSMGKCVLAGFSLGLALPFQRAD